MMADVITYAATENERSILDDIEEVGYGELYDIEHSDQQPEKVVQVSQKILKFFRTLKSIKQVSKLIIFDGEPSILEVRTKTENGRRCLKRIKF
jgi:hypothetical protein